MSLISPEVTQKLLLEQCVHIHALLSTILSVQMKILAHLTEDSFEAVRDHYVQDQLNEFQAEIVEEMKMSIAAQSKLRDKS